jgi:phage-related protein (TIGR01555 family)
MLGAGGTKGVETRPNLGFWRLTGPECGALYRANAYARRFIHVFPLFETRKGWKIVDGSKDPRPMELVDRRLKVRAAVRQARIWARLNGGALIVMVTDEGVGDERQLAEPLDLAKVNRVTNLITLSRWECSPVGWVSDPTDPDYGEPAAWQVSPIAPGGAGRFAGAIIHRSRCLRFFGADLPPEARWENDSWGDSELQAVWEALRRLSDSDGYLSEMLGELKSTVLKQAGDASYGEVGQEAEAIQQRMYALTMNRSVMSTVVLAPGEDFEHVASPVSGAADLSDRLRQAWSAATGIPMYRLFGVGANGLNANDASAADGWYEDVSASQEDNLREPLERLYSVIYASKQGPTKGVVPEDWRLEFLPLDELGQAEIADLRTKEATLDALYLDRGVLTPEQVAASRFGPDGWQDIQPAGEDESFAGLEAALASIAAEVSGTAPSTTPTPKTDSDLARETLADLRAAVERGEDIADLLEDLAEALEG